jgi:hypothetical protein
MRHLVHRLRALGPLGRVEVVVSVCNITAFVAAAFGAAAWTLKWMGLVGAAGCLLVLLLGPQREPDDSDGRTAEARRVPWLVHAVFAATTLALAVGLYLLIRDGEPEESATVVVLLDTARPLGHDATVGYTSAVRRIAEKLAASGGTLVVATVAEAAGPPVFARRYSFDRRWDVTRRHREEHHVRISAAALLHEAGQGPLGAVRPAVHNVGAFYHGHPETTPKYLVVFSSFDEPAGPVERDRAAGLLPDLRGVDVYLVAHETAAPGTLERLRRWQAYIRASGGRLGGEDPTTALLGFP